jgi:hypothetical protein
MKLTSPTMGMAQLKNSCLFLKNVTMWLKTFKYTCPDSLSLFFFLKIFTNVKNKYENGIFYHVSFEKKKSLDLQKIESCCDIYLLLLVW